MIPVQKTCTQCKITKDADEFWRRTIKSAQYLSSWCKKCTRKSLKSDKYKEYYRTYQEKYRIAGRHLETAKRSLIKLRAKYPERYKSRAKASWAVFHGKLTRKTFCEKCGSSPPLQRNGASAIQKHHHKGYDHPLDVQWLCIPCHRKADKLLKLEV